MLNNRTLTLSVAVNRRKERRMKLSAKQIRAIDIAIAVMEAELNIGLNHKQAELHIKEAVKELQELKNKSL